MKRLLLISTKPESQKYGTRFKVFMSLDGGLPPKHYNYYICDRIVNADGETTVFIVGGTQVCNEHVHELMSVDIAVDKYDLWCAWGTERSWSKFIKFFDNVLPVPEPNLKTYTVEYRVIKRIEQDAYWPEQAVQALANYIIPDDNLEVVVYSDSDSTGTKYSVQQSHEFMAQT